MAIPPRSTYNKSSNGRRQKSQSYPRPCPVMSDSEGSFSESSDLSESDSSSSSWGDSDNIYHGDQSDHSDHSEHSEHSEHSYNNSVSPSQHFNYHKKPHIPPHSQYVAMDCEMVGTLTGESVAARVVLINWKGKIIFDAYIRPDCQITDYRTFVSGITEKNLKKRGEPAADVCAMVQSLIRNKIVIGHGLQNDLQSLGIQHPWYMVRDTAYYEPFMQSRSQQDYIGHSKYRWDEMLPRKLKDLAWERLGRSIQIPGQAHCPAEDAKAALSLYKSHRRRWEKCLQSEINRMLRQQRRQLQKQLQIYGELPHL